MKLDVRGFAIASGVVWGGGLFLLTWWMMAFSGATGEATFIGRVYLGYCISPLGSLIGLLWGFIDGLVSGIIFAWIYNGLAARTSCKKE